MASLVVSALAASATFAQQPPSRPVSPVPNLQTAPALAMPSDGVDTLFERLAKAGDAEEGKGIAALIERRWNRSGSDLADLLMQRALTALQPKDRDIPLAIELLDRIVMLEPNWAEAWNKRATAFFLLGDHQRALLDVRQTLAREPRHFEALAGLGHLFQALGDTRKAYDAYARAFALHPQMDRLRETIDKLKPDAQGRDI